MLLQLTGAIMTYPYDAAGLQGSTSTMTSATRSCSFSHPSRSAPTTTTTYPPPRPTQVLNEPGLENREYEYLPFGGTYQPGTKITVKQRYAYAGRELNPTSALMYYRYWQYDPRVGRSGARDPVESSVQVDLYSYVGNRSASHTDAMGLRATTGSIATSVSGGFGDVKSLSLKCLCGDLRVVAQLDGVFDRYFMAPDGLPGGTNTEEGGAGTVGAYLYFEFVPNKRCGKAAGCCCSSYRFKQFTDPDWVGVQYGVSPSQDYFTLPPAGHDSWGSLSPDTSHPDGWYPNPDDLSEGTGGTGYCGGKAWMADVPGIPRPGFLGFDASIQGRTTVNCYKKPNPRDREPYVELRWLVYVRTGWRGAKVQLKLDAKCDTGWTQY